MEGNGNMFKRVLEKFFDSYLKNANGLLGNCLGIDRQLNNKNAVTYIPIEALNGEILGYIHVQGNMTLLEGLKHIAWKDDHKPYKWFNLYDINGNLHCYNSLISKSIEVFRLMPVQYELQSKEYLLSIARLGVRAVIDEASKELRGDKEVVLAAMANKFDQIQFATEELCDNKDFILAALKKDVNVFIWASDNLWSNRDFVLAVVKQKSRLIKFASEELQKDPDIAAAALL